MQHQKFRQGCIICVPSLYYCATPHPMTCFKVSSGLLTSELMTDGATAKSKPPNPKGVNLQEYFTSWLAIPQKSFVMMLESDLLHPTSRDDHEMIVVTLATLI